MTDAERPQNRHLKPFRKGQGGRPRGAKNKIPGSVKKLLERIELEHGGEGGLIEKAILKGLRGSHAHRFIELLLERRLGKVAPPIEAKVSQPIQLTFPAQTEEEDEEAL